MSIICPTILAADPHEFRSQVERVQPFAKRVQIDLMDGEFAPTKSIELESLWLPEGIECDIHLMYQRPDDYREELIKLAPSMVIIHAESESDIKEFARELRNHGIKTGIAILQETSVSAIEHLLPDVQHVLIFSGSLGRFGGEADLSLLSKVAELKALGTHVEIGWDGGININNARQLSDKGVDVLNVGGAIQHAKDPKDAYEKLESTINSI